MLEHYWPTAKTPERVVVLGASGFIGRALVAALEKANIPSLALRSADLDLAGVDAGDKLAGMLRGGDAVVFLSAITRDRNREMAATMRNLAMGEQVCRALAKQPLAHAVYVSSDGVYPLGRGLVSERTPAEPTDSYSAMHLAREQMIREVAGATPVAVVRPCIVYGPGDTHVSYAPSRLLRQAATDRAITLFGAGEDKRDFIFVDDLAELLRLVLSHRSVGLLNAVSGRSISYGALARHIVAAVGGSVEIKSAERRVPVVHRAFDVTNRIRAFPAFGITSIEDGLAQMARAHG